MFDLSMGMGVVSAEVAAPSEPAHDYSVYIDASFYSIIYSSLFTSGEQATDGKTYKVVIEATGNLSPTWFFQTAVQLGTAGTWAGTNSHFILINYGTISANATNAAPILHDNDDVTVLDVYNFATISDNVSTWLPSGVNLTATSSSFNYYTEWQ